jgi:hypothetical protein
VRSDNVQDNAQGMNPYAYVSDNPETRTDPTGHRYIMTCGGGATVLTPQVFAADANAYYERSQAPTLDASGLPPVLYLKLYHVSAYNLMDGYFSMKGELSSEASTVTRQIDGLNPKDPHALMDYANGIAETDFGSAISNAQGEEEYRGLKEVLVVDRNSKAYQILRATSILFRQYREIGNLQKYPMFLCRRILGLSILTNINNSTWVGLKVPPTTIFTLLVMVTSSWCRKG